MTGSKPITKTFTLGKMDLNGTGKKLNRAEIEMTFDPVHITLSISAGVWNRTGTDYLMGGQCVDEVAGFFPENPTAQRLLKLWQRWHLNNLKAGSPAQEAWLQANPVSYAYPKSHYEAACEALAAAGLNPDPSYLVDGKPYAYGTRWLKEEIPFETQAEILALLNE